jgi:hypothetical protein
MKRIQSEIGMSQEEFDQKFPITGNIKGYNLSGYRKSMSPFARTLESYDNFPEMWGMMKGLLLLALLTF